MVRKSPCRCVLSELLLYLIYYCTVPNLLPQGIRECVVASEGCVLLSVDYAQLELRIIAHLSQDPVLLAALLEEGAAAAGSGGAGEGGHALGGGRGGGGAERKCDVFDRMASSWLKMPLNKVRPSDRDRAKRVCYGLMYGMGAGTLSEELGVSAGACMEP